MSNAESALNLFVMNIGDMFIILKFLEMRYCDDLIQ